MKRTCGKILVALLAALVLAAGCGSDDDDVSPAAEYKVLAGRLVWCAESLERATVPENASSIGNNAFRNCPALTSVSIPASVEQIGSSTFSGVAVKEITYGNTMRAWDALARGSGIVATLAEITVRCTDGIWGAGMYDWEITDGVLTRYCGDAAVAVIPKSVTAIGDGAFAGRADITGVTIPGGVTSIGADAFKDCAKLTGINIPDGVTGIGAEAFAGCAGLADIDIPASVESIGTGAIGAGTTVTYHGTKAQWEALAANAGLEGLTAFIIDENGTLTGYCGSAADITLPDGVKGIAGGAFAGHAELERVTVPAGVTAIAPDTFTGSGITEISYGGTMAEWGALVEAGGIAAEVADITVTCAGCGRQSLPEAHTWGSHTSGGADGHYQTCTACTAASATEPHQYAYTGSDADSHTETCSLCAHTKSEPHAYGGETCTDAGHTKSCADCGHSETKPHKWSGYADDGTGYHSKTCTADGFEAHTERAAHGWGAYSDEGNGSHRRTCAGCGRTESAPHGYDGAPYTDSGDGNHHQTCTDCPATKTEPHAYGGETCTDAGHTKSCTDAGHTKSCADCGHSETKPHKWSTYAADGTDTHSRTCTADGFEAHTERVAHSYGTTYTDDKNGKHYRTCSVCSGQSEAVAHTYGTTYTDDKNGKHYQTCSACGGQSEAVAHSYGTTYTDDKNGKHYQTCSVCGGTSEAVAHSYGTAYTDDKNGKHYQVCSACNAKSASVTHSYDGYTDDKSGKHYQTCTACNAKSASEAHDCEYKDNADGTHTTTCTKCDYANTAEEHRYENGACLDCKCPHIIYLNSSNGDDANSGLIASKAVKTLSKAIELFEAQGAQKIMVCAEYTLPSEESTLLDRAGGEHLTFMRYTGKSDVSDIFKGTFFRISQGDVTISNVTLDGKITGYSTEPLLYISGSSTVVTLGDDAVICNNSDSGVFIYSGTFKMTGGEITKNTGSLGGGVRINRGTFKMSGGVISGNSGGGVCIETANGAFTMTGGTITDNTTNAYGGGVCLRMDSTFTMNGGTIKNCTAGSGGGGVCIMSNSAIFTMKDGTITGNTAKNGGGVYVNGKFTMSGGEITGNTATSNGGGVYKTASGTFTQGGTVSGNTPDDVYTAP